MTTDVLELLRAEVATLRAEVATLRALVVDAGDMAALSRLLEQAHTAFEGRRWTVAHLVDLGIVDADDARSVGRLLARLPYVEADGLCLVPDGLVARGRAWRVVQGAGNSLPVPCARG